jgi:hypothetical protein
MATIHAAKVRLHSSLLVGMSGNLSLGKCLASDSLLDSFSVSHHSRQIRDMVLVRWKAPSVPWLKVNMDGSVIGNHVACGGLFRDRLGTFLGAFISNLGNSSVFTAEIHGFILALEYAAHNGWRNLWLESDSTSVLIIFPVLLRNRWHNACKLGVQVIYSHIFILKY